MQINELTKLKWTGGIYFKDLDVDLENKIKQTVDDWNRASKSPFSGGNNSLSFSHRTESKPVKLEDEISLQAVPDCNTYYVGVNCEFNFIKDIKKLFLEKLGEVEYTMALNGFRSVNKQLEPTEYRIVKTSYSNDYHIYKGKMVPVVTYDNQVGVL